jgi:hypothetical protein
MCAFRMVSRIPTMASPASNHMLIARVWSWQVEMYCRVRCCPTVACVVHQFRCLPFASSSRSLASIEYNVCYVAKGALGIISVAGRRHFIILIHFPPDSRRAPFK